MTDITAEILLNAYANGYFPMAESADSTELHWFYPEKRGILPLKTLHIPRNLAKFLRKNPFSYTTNQRFEQVMRACAQRDGGTWINEKIIQLYCELHKMGHAHSVEVWNEDGQNLVGGLYGVSLGGAFFGESMFSRSSNASKAALAHLVPLLNKAGYTLLDAQYVNDHLKQFGIIEITRDEYLEKLGAALKITPNNTF